MKAIQIIGNKTVLRDFRNGEEFEQIRLWRNMPENRRLFFTNHEISVEEHIEWGRRVHEDSFRCIFAITEKESDRITGYISMLLDFEKKEVEFGIMIGEVADRGAGYAEEAESMLCIHAATQYGIKHAVMEVFSSNERAIRFYEKAGYRKSSVVKDSKMQDGHFCDVVVMKKSI